MARAASGLPFSGFPPGSSASSVFFSATAARDERVLIAGKNPLRLLSHLPSSGSGSLTTAACLRQTRSLAAVSDTRFWMISVLRARCSRVVRPGNRA